MGYIVFFIILLVVAYSDVSNSNKLNTRTISLDDINVGDMLLVKGEKFTVTNYTPDGMFELLNNGGVYYVDLSKGITFKRHKEKKYIEVIGFKGTVKSGYLNKLKV